MSIEYHKSMRKTGPVIDVKVLALVLMSLVIFLPPVLAENSAPSDIKLIKAPEDAQLILRADELIYNRDLDLITAKGGVKIDYGPYKLVAETVEYNQSTARVRAIGNVELIEPDGNQIFAEELDVTDNFSDGFVKSLRIITPDNTHISASRAERKDGDITVFDDGVYTACSQCTENPAKPPLWQIKSSRVISNGKANTLRFENPVFEFAGIPLITLPSFTIPAHNNTHRSGFLIPSIGFSNTFGLFAKVPYYFALAPNMDATLTANGYTKTGFMTELEFRQKFNTGSHTLQLAGAYQTNPDQFDHIAGFKTSDGRIRQRGFIASKAEFQIDPKWKLGWDGMVQSDQNFARSYAIKGYDNIRQTSQAYLTGLGTSSYFDLHGYKFDVQDDTIGSQADKQQALVYPVVDYHRILSNDVTGGDFKLTFNAQHLSRETEKRGSGRIEGLDGHNGRMTTEFEWKKQFVTENGLLFVPLLAARGDFHSFNVKTLPVGLAGGKSTSRGLLTAGLEVKYPLLFTTSSSSHVLEPVAQIFVRNNEKLSGRLPNEDAQSFVFDASNLFARDKFSGFDRIEGGTRLNLGIRYNGSFTNGFTSNAIFGQSFHLAGQNSFSQKGLTGAGADSGLETDRSDFVGAFTINNGKNTSLAAAARFDKDTFAVERTTLAGDYVSDTFSASLTYSDINAQTGYGSSSDREEVSASTSFNFTEDWRIFANTTYDIDRKNFTKSTAGLEFENECYIVTGVYNHMHKTGTAKEKWSVGLRMSFRTLGTINAGKDPVGREF